MTTDEENCLLAHTIERIKDILSEEGCFCDCEHSQYDHDDECLRCTGCRISAVLCEERDRADGLRRVAGEAQG